MQWAAAETGWLERNWFKADIQYVRIEGQAEPVGSHTISVGVALDPVLRSLWCLYQIQHLLILAKKGRITDTDVIYFDDFWHPGIEALPYAFQQMGIRPRMYAFCHAQSVDEFDFTYPMRDWMRPFERGIGRVLDGIFVNSPLLKRLLVSAEIGTNQSVHVIGHIFSSEEVEERMPKAGDGESRAKFQRQDTVLFTSRWDDEKNPLFFLDVMKRVSSARGKVRFIICTSAKKLRSNNQINLTRLKRTMQDYPTNIFLKEDLTKEEYYKELCKAKIQMNTANQDWVSIALLEASVAGCYPVYPMFRSFPRVFDSQSQYMYEHLNISSAVKRVIEVLDNPDLWTCRQIRERRWIHTRHDTSWIRMLRRMGMEQFIDKTKVPELESVKDDPYAKE